MVILHSFSSLYQLLLETHFGRKNIYNIGLVDFFMAATLTINLKFYCGLTPHSCRPPKTAIGNQQYMKLSFHSILRSVAVSDSETGYCMRESNIHTLVTLKVEIISMVSFSDLLFLPCTIGNTFCGNHQYGFNASYDIFSSILL